MLSNWYWASKVRATELANIAGKYVFEAYCQQQSLVSLLLSDTEQF